VVVVRQHRGRRWAGIEARLRRGMEPEWGSGPLDVEARDQPLPHLSRPGEREAARCRGDPVSSAALSAGACLMFRSIYQHLQLNIGIQLQKR
jgi:hypothetical protein